MPRRDEFLEGRDVRYLRDMELETLDEIDRRQDPATVAITCKCGHTIGHHYQGTMAMPCGKCSCMKCTAPRAEDVRRDRARKGLQDITPHPDFRKRR